MFVLGEVFGAGILAVLRNAPPGVYFVDQNLDHIAMYMGNSLKTALYRVLDEGEDKIIETSKEYND
jgi:S-adenosylmethionine:diacylglycerol 3-amino-3-carboxypropyl transferase